MRVCYGFFVKIHRYWHHSYILFRLLTITNSLFSILMLESECNMLYKYSYLNNEQKKAQFLIIFSDPSF